MKFVLALIVGALTGVISSWGIGGGTLLVLYMSAFTKMPQQSAQGINLLYFLPTAAAALVSHIKNKLVVWRAVIPAVITGVPVAVLTAILAVGIEKDLMRKLFGVFVILVGISELLRKPKEEKEQK